MAAELNVSAGPAGEGTPRVLIVPASYLATERTVGGGERYAMEYARALAKLTPTTIGFFDLVPGKRRVGALDVQHFELPEVRERFFVPLPKATRAQIAEFDVIHLMVFPTPLADQLILLSRLNGQTAVLTDVGGGKPSITTYLRRLDSRLGIPRLADGLAPLSQHSADQFAGWAQPRVILYGGATPSDGASRADEPPAEPYALFVGRLLPHKGVLELIEAVDGATALHVVGRPYDPAYVTRLQDAARGKAVRFFFDADDQELARQYRGARVVLQPSVPVREGQADTSELLGLVTLEGMAHGKPVVVTSVGSLPELVRDGVTGFVVPPRDRSLLADRIERLMRDPELAGRMGESGRALVERSFTWDRVARRGLDFYRQLAGSKRGR